MTKPEAVTQEDNEATNSILYCVVENSFDTEGRFKLDMEKVAQAFARHRIAAEQRGMERERERCATGLASIEIPPEGFEDKIDAWLKAINIGLEAIRQGATP